LLGCVTNPWIAEWLGYDIACDHLCYRPGSDRDIRGGTLEAAQWQETV